MFSKELIDSTMAYVRKAHRTFLYTDKVPAQVLRKHPAAKAVVYSFTAHKLEKALTDSETCDFFRVRYGRNLRWRGTCNGLKVYNAFRHLFGDDDLRCYPVFVELKGSDAQELYVAENIVTLEYAGKGYTFQWTGRKKAGKDGKYIPDVTGYNAEGKVVLRLEVKGIDGQFTAEPIHE